MGCDAQLDSWGELRGGVCLGGGYLGEKWPRGSLDPHTRLQVSLFSDFDFGYPG